MTIRKENGTRITKAGITASLTEKTQPSKWVAKEDVYETYDTSGSGSSKESQRRKVLVKGQTYSQADINALFPPATITSVAPTALAAAGGTAVTIKGTNFRGASGVQIEGGVAFTSVKIVDDNTITAVSPAKAAGTWDIIVQDDAGDVTKTDAVTTA